MLPFPPPGPAKGLSKTQRRLLERFDALSTADRETLLAFADFLASRSATAEPVVALPADEAQPIERPAEETVVAAIKRLTLTYPMIDRGLVLHETSDLMSQHILQGRPAVDVIDALEALFLQHYRQHDPR